jgi:CRP-like cAMP-binding protein
MTLEPETELFHQGEVADGGYAVLSGSVALERQGEIPTPVHLMGSGSLIGVHALIVPGERPATATARERSFLIRLPRRLMLRVLEAFPESAIAFKRYIESGLADQAKALARLADAIDAVAKSYRSRESRTGT